MSPVVEAQDLDQRRGRKLVLRHLNFSVTTGVVGVLGPNGAGKTTLFETLATLLAPASGTLKVFGRSVSRRQDRQFIRQSIGYLPQNFGYLPSFTLHEFVEYVAWLKGMNQGSRRGQAVARALEDVGLIPYAKKAMRTLSGGMIRRAGIAAAMVSQPKLLLLDEPTVGLDPRQRAEFRTLLRSIGQTTPVLLSTHLLEDISVICSEVIVLRDGRLGFHGSTQQLADQGKDDGLGDSALERGYNAVAGPSAAGELHL